MITTWCSGLQLPSRGSIVFQSPRGTAQPDLWSDRDGDDSCQVTMLLWAGSTDPLLTALRTAAFRGPHGSPLHTHLLLAPFLTHPPSTLSCAEKGISPLGSHFLLLTSLKDHLFLSRAQIFTESLNCDWSLLGW